MTQSEQPVTFLQKIETLFEELKNDLEARIGTHVAILDGVANAKMGVLTATAEHFGEDSEEVGKDAPAPAALTSTTSSSAGQSAQSGDLTAAIEEAEQAVKEANDKPAV